MPNTPTAPRALVIGGSLGGLVAGLLLRRAGWNVTIFERTGQELSGRGAGIVTHRELWNVMSLAGIDPSRQDGVDVAERVILAPDGSVVAHCDFAQTMTSWDRLFGMLRDLWGQDDYQLGRELAGFQQDSDGVIAHFTDGSSIKADLLVGADGFRSTIRTLAFPDRQPLYAGYVGWRGMVDEADIPPSVHHGLFLKMAFCLVPGEQMVGYPVAGDNLDLRPGHRRYNYVWYRPVDEAKGLPDLLTDSAGHTHAMSIPPPLIRPELIASMRADAERLLAPQFATLVRATKAPFLQPIYDFEATAIGFGHVALIGDAAFIARPHIGAGVTKAAEDALALVRALQESADIPTALARYNAERLPAGRAIVQRARHLGAYMQAHLATDEEREAARRHHSAEAVMAETATLNF